LNHQTKLPGQQLLKKRKLITSSRRNGWLTVDISDQNILIEDSFFVSLKWIDIESKVPLLGMNFKPEKSFFRIVALGDWYAYLNANIKVTGSVVK
ncbi:MAG: hypothetical protein AAF391_09705, partial [Bacteroidota bacterium]